MRQTTFSERVNHVARVLIGGWNVGMTDAYPVAKYLVSRKDYMVWAKGFGKPPLPEELEIWHRR